MKDENESDNELMTTNAAAISAESGELAHAVGYMTSGRHPIVCTMALIAVAAHHAQHANLDKNDFIELAANMWTTAHENHAAACNDNVKKRSSEH